MPEYNREQHLEIDKTTKKHLKIISWYQKKKPKQKLYSTGKHKYLQVIRNNCNERIRQQKLWDKPEFGKMYSLNAYIEK